MNEKELEQEIRKQVCDEIRECCNLEHKPIQDEFGDTSFGYTIINADKLNKFLYQIEKLETLEIRLQQLEMKYDNLIKYIEKYPIESNNKWGKPRKLKSYDI